jgi:hypothetical protein
MSEFTATIVAKADPVFLFIRPVMTDLGYSDRIPLDGKRHDRLYRLRSLYRESVSLPVRRHFKSGIF